jgi:drug/metabolite transporter (DMT)-like permease
VTQGGRTLAVVAALGVVYVVWGSTYLGIALAIETMPPLLMAAVRFLIAGAILYAVARRLAPKGAHPDRAQWAAALLTGGLLLGVGNGGVSWAQQTVPSGVAALVIATIPLWIVVLDRLFFGARLRWISVAGVAAGFVGVAILANPASPKGIDTTGGLLLLVAAVGWATGTLLSRGQRLTVAPLLGAGMQMLCGGAALLVAGLAAGEASQVDLGAVSARSALGLTYLILFGSILAFSAYVWLLRNAGTSLVATYAYVNPIVAVALGAAFLDEAVTGRTLVAGGLVIGAVALIVSSGARPRMEPAEGRSGLSGAPSRHADRAAA